ncbi:RNA polymerase II transcriptional coactivator KELP [Impatiens glandulifera]|uniref:RNA polymerase II transcriptional coactivator KELP n=1 Tax=Impatiens glandulifera TaxID=253017 RepID=UPI001FB0A6B1|nr:RNA polymerase II transcriptional coactivator KELP [Impatiens glandulifera]
MESALKEKIEETVIEILRGSNMDEATEFKIRKSASEKLGIDLSVPERKKFVRQVVEAFLLEQQAKEAANAAVEEEEQQADDEPEKEMEMKKEVEEEVEEEEEEEDVKPKIVGEKEFDDEGDLIICRLSDKRRVTIQDFRGKTLVSIREYYKVDGKDRPSAKGISLTVEQWSALKDNVSEIEKVISKMQCRLE